MYAPHWNHNTISDCSNSTQLCIQMILQGSDVGGSVCSSGLLGHVVPGLAPLLEGPVPWLLGGIMGFLWA